MAASRNRSVGMLGTGLAQFAQTMFSPSFPLVLISLCAVSYLLASGLRSPELGLWGFLGLTALYYAQAHAWAAVALAVAGLAALGLAWLAYRGRNTGLAGTLGEWVVAAIVLGFAMWLRTMWPYNGSDAQVFAYSFLLFVGWGALVEAAVDTLALLVRGTASA